MRNRVGHTTANNSFTMANQIRDGNQVKALRIRDTHTTRMLYARVPLINLYPLSSDIEITSMHKCLDSLRTVGHTHELYTPA